VDAACDRFEKAWQDGQRPCIEEYLAAVPEPDRVPLFRELLALEIELRCNGGERPTPEEYHHRFREHSELIRAAFADSPGDAGSGPPGSSGGATTPHIPPPDSSAVDPVPPPLSGSLPVPDHIGRYKVVRRLGGGTYGDVYLAHDAVMDRDVAVKVPSARLLATDRAKEEFLREARSVARLKHKGIVRAYDFGQEPDGRCYIVYEFVDGESLAERIKPERIAADPLGFDEAARTVAEVAEALHYAHLQGIFNRDVKPANILLDRQGKPKVTDFGLAVREEELAGEKGRLAGTLPYMSPEQVRREGHRLDGRTDVYSLGVVLYELLCGRRPFTMREDELIDQILNQEARPPRQIRDSIPREMERVCLKALSKRVGDRYPTAGDMADDLWRAVMPPVPTASAGEGGRSAAAPGRGAPVVKYYLYVSDSKVQMLFAQIPQGVVSRLAEELQIDVRQWGGGRHQLPEEATRFARAAIVQRFIEQNVRVGSIDEPAEYFRGSLEVRWGELGHGLVYFGGETTKTILGLGGSAYHMIGALGRSALSVSSTRALLHALYKGLGKFEFGNLDAEEFALRAVVRATMEMDGPKQRVDFLAKRLLHGPSEERNVLLGTPISVALAE
jgi:hypothetical protein